MKVIVQARTRGFWEQLSQPTQDIARARMLLNLCRNGSNRELYFKYKTQDRTEELGNCWNEFRILIYKGLLHKSEIRKGNCTSLT